MCELNVIDSNLLNIGYIILVGFYINAFILIQFLWLNSSIIPLITRKQGLI
jgi:hypothetical protein